tara:strand:+ start:561 stop:1973 length:1413 start_codon:yes stop_codon:yes gene_type:complete
LKHYNSLKKIQQDLKLNKITCLELVNGYLSNVAKHKDLNAFIETYDVEAQEKAIIIDDKIKNNKAGKLAGLVIGVKDNICYKNHSSTAASKILKGYNSPYSATVVERLIREDAIILGRLNCDEFAMGSTNKNSIYGPVANPINKEYVPGGSSGGSAAAVKANLCHAALGTDTGGSIRQPSAFCGVYGLKPTYGLVSRHGLIAYASSFDQIGPITKSVDDIDKILDVISGKDDFDGTCVGNITLRKNYQESSKPTKFAIPKEVVDFKEINIEIKTHFSNLLDKIVSKGHTVEYINLPLLDYLVPAYYILTTAEASSNLARYDGIKYGYREGKDNLEELIKNTRTNGFGREVKRRILLGTFVLSQGYYDAYYIKAQKIRHLIKKQTEEILKTYDYMLLPTSPNLPFKINEDKSPTKLYNEDIFTVQSNLSGHPSLSIPLSLTKDKFFSSAQLIGNYFSEREMLDVANNIITN